MEKYEEKGCGGGRTHHLQTLGLKNIMKKVDEKEYKKAV